MYTDLVTSLLSSKKALRSTSEDVQLFVETIKARSLAASMSQPDATASVVADTKHVWEFGHVAWTLMSDSGEPIAEALFDSLTAVMNTNEDMSGGVQLEVDKMIVINKVLGKRKGMERNGRSWKE